MSLSVGIVGFPNVGKSTLFNALLKRQVALAANYPFATIDPNVGIAEVPDNRLSKLAEIVKTSVIKPATVEFLDIAGLVAGASQGAGLGNKFLAHIRETDLLCHVLRAFEDSTIIREGTVDPLEDIKAIRLELQLADLATVQKQSEPKGSTDLVQKKRWQRIGTLTQWLESGKLITEQIQSLITEDQQNFQILCHELCLLSAKLELFVLNISEQQIHQRHELVRNFAQALNVSEQTVLPISAKLESELAVLSREDQQVYLQELGLAQSGFDQLARAAYEQLGLLSFLTAGEKEVRAWTIRQGATAPQAAGVIHSDFEKKFIKANIVSYEDFIAVGGWRAAREEGKIRVEGRDYVMHEGDVVEFMVGS